MFESTSTSEASQPSPDHPSGSSIPYHEVPMIPTTEEMKFAASAAGTSKPTGSLLPPSRPSAPTGSALLVTAGCNPQELERAKADAERAKWNAAFDAAQPSRRSLSVKDWEYQEILRAYRENQPYQPKEQETVVQEPNVKPAKKRFWKF